MKDHERWQQAGAEAFWRIENEKPLLSNRDKVHRPRRRSGKKFWCSYCDGALVSSGRRCSYCKKKDIGKAFKK